MTPTEQVTDRILTVPNVISLVRLSLVPVFAWIFLTRTADAAAFVLLIVIGTTDWVDGFVARRIGQVSRLGKLLDPVADRIAIVIVLAALSFRGTVDWRIAAVIVTRDLIVAILFPILEARGVPRIPVNRTGKTATALIFFGVAFAAGSLVIEEQWIGALSTALLAAGAVTYWAAGILYAIEARKRLAGR